MDIENRNITLLSLLKEIEKRGYIVLTYNEAKNEFNIVPENFNKVYFYFKLNKKRYFIFNNKTKEIKKYVETFLKYQKINSIKKYLFYILERW